MRKNLKKQNNKKKSNLIPSIFIFLLVAVGITVIYWYSVSKQNDKDARELSYLGFTVVPKDIAQKHLWITRNAPDVLVNSNYMPVHILKKDERGNWAFIGSGTRLTKYGEGALISARHVFEGKGQYAWRRISKNALYGKEPIVPITGFDEPGASVDDALMCKSGGTNEAPLLYLSVSTNNFSDFQHQNSYTAMEYNKTLRLLTYPDKGMLGTFSIEVRKGVQYLYFAGDVVPGESGTGALCNDGTTDLFCVIIRRYGTDGLKPSLKSRVPVGCKNLTVAYPIRFNEEPAH